MLFNAAYSTMLYSTVRLNDAVVQEQRHVTTILALYVSNYWILPAAFTKHITKLCML